MTSIQKSISIFGLYLLVYLKRKPIVDSMAANLMCFLLCSSLLLL